MRTAADPSPGSRDRRIGPAGGDEPGGHAVRRLRRIAAALGLTGGVLLLHAWALRDGDRGAAGRPAGASVPSLQVRSVPLAVAAPPPATSVASTRAAPPARTLPAPPARPGPVPAPVRVAEPAPPAVVAADGPSPRPAGAAAAHLRPAGTDQAASGSPLPVYATRVPPTARMRYEVRHGAWRTEAIVDWWVGEGAYRLRLQTLSAQGKPIEQLSEGAFDAAGLAPVRLADRRRGRGAQAANFERDQARISFSGPRWAFALEPGTQDRLSWMVQLSAIGAGGAVVDGAEVALQVVSARGASSRWRFEVEGTEMLASPLGALRAWRLVRQPEHLYDLRVEVWLDPQRGWWPVRLRQTQAPGGEPADWWLVEEPAATPGT